MKQSSLTSLRGALIFCNFSSGASALLCSNSPLTCSHRMGVLAALPLNYPSWESI